ncbi:preprotein translocase subunit YajC [Pedobacter sp. UYP24]
METHKLRTERPMLKAFQHGMLCLLLTVAVLPSRAQSTEVQQLLLNVEKLSQLKNILSDMKKGYTIVTNGYNAVKNISQGNFSLHEVFLEVRSWHMPDEHLVSLQLYRKLMAFCTGVKL